jgi:hypothetical protein
MADSHIESTWAIRELPILAAALRFVDAGEAPRLADLCAETGLSPRDFRVGLEALANADPPYVEVDWAGGWSDEKVGGFRLNDVSERTRRELGSWPSANGLVEQLVAALDQAAENELEPERKKRLSTTAGVLGGMARDIAVSVIATRLGRID